MDPSGHGSEQLQIHERHVVIEKANSHPNVANELKIVGKLN
jgi:hypothetical protein